MQLFPTSNIVNNMLKGLVGMYWGYGTHTLCYAWL
jgi:hypothetical protein